MKTALATCLVFCLYAADLNGQDYTYEQQDSLEGITWFRVSATYLTFEDRDRPSEDDRYIKDLVELNLRKYGVPVTPTQSGGAELRVWCYLDSDEFWRVTLAVEQRVLLIHRNNVTKKHMDHFCKTYELKTMTDAKQNSKQEGVEKLLTTFLNNYLAVNEKYRNTQQVQPTPTPASNQPSPLPSNRRTTEPSKVIQVGGIGG